MKNFLLFLVLMIISSTIVFSQVDELVRPSSIGHGMYLGETPPLRDIPAMSPEEYRAMEIKAQKRLMNPKLKDRAYPFAEIAFPRTEDGVWQKNHPKGPVTTSNTTILQNFSGLNSPYYPSDANGTVGPNHYMQTVNTSYAIYSKTGTLLAGPTNMNQLFGSVPGANYNDGDPLIQYDEVANRWIAVEFSVSGTNDFMLIAVSTTNDPTGTWHKYSFDVDDMPDYEKLGIWGDGYYMGTNTPGGTKKDIYVFERSVMLNGGSNPKMISFHNPWRPVTIDGFNCVPPIDCNGIAPPAGSPGMFISVTDDAIAGGSDQIWLYELTPNWTTPSNSTFNRVQQINVEAFDSNFGNSWNNIAQQGTSMKVDAIPQLMMNTPYYRNFGTYQTIVCCHTVDVDNSDHAGIRWYELRKTGSSNWTIRQQGTYAPDSHSRWMGSIAINQDGNIALGYSISSSSMYPGIRCVGQSNTEYQNASGIMDLQEIIVQTGTRSQSANSRWGDYSLMSVDPSNNKDFWFTTEYVGQSSSPKATKIVAFSLSNAPSVITLAPTNIGQTSATMNGSVNPNSKVTTYHFEWGTTPSYGTSTTTASAGSGSAAVPVSSNIANLTNGTKYHYRIVATSSEGTSYGKDTSFIAGGATIQTSQVSNITISTVTSGGTVIADGGSPISQRGVCWSTTPNPTIANSFTNDGTGLGAFVSNISGLESSTKYYLRAYAKNSTGTFYGNEISFTTSCGTFSTPYIQNFDESGVIPTCWSQNDYLNNGQIWKFGTFTGTGAPNLYGNYAYINSDSYGSGSSQNADLISPTIDCSNLQEVTLTFKHYYRHYSNSKGTLSYSINDGNTWTVLETFTASTANPIKYTKKLPQGVAGSTSVKFKWNYQAVNAYWWAIDSVTVTGIEQDPLTVTPQTQNVGYQSGEINFTVTTADNWVATSNGTWCTVTPSGTGNGTLKATYTENPNTEQRTANISVSIPNYPPVVVNLIQNGMPIPFEVLPSEINVTSEAGLATFTVKSSRNWTVSSNVGWATPESASGSGSTIANITYTENTDATSRTAEITFIEDITSISITVKIIQDGAGNFLLVSPDQQILPSDGGTTEFSVSTNLDWTAVSDSDWCAVTSSGSGNGTIVANVIANELFLERTATITVKAGSALEKTVYIIQRAPQPFLEVTPGSQSVEFPAGSAEFDVNSNVVWRAISDALWCSTTSSGVGNGKVVVDFEANPAEYVREANISVKSDDAPTVVVILLQLPSASTNIDESRPVVIYPNPTKGYFIIKNYNNRIFNMNLRMYNTSGQILIDKNYIGKDAYEFDIQSYKSGVYYITAEIDNKIIRWKLIKN